MAGAATAWQDVGRAGGSEPEPIERTHRGVGAVMPTDGADLHDARATWVMPHWTDDFDRTRPHLEAAVDSVLGQSDRASDLVIVDDHSDDPRALTHLRRLADRWPDRVHLIAQPVNRGAGEARNVAIEHAADRGSAFVLFLDADDLARAGRLAHVREAFGRRPSPGVVYSTFDVIDPAGRAVPLEAMTGSIAEVIEEHRKGPPQGPESWIAIGTETGYVNHTSSTAVRTEVALAHPFPNERVSEDAHTWLRYSGGGARFAYLDEPLSAYRTTVDDAGSSSRSREGGKHGFYVAKARVDADGFRCAMQLAHARRAMERAEIADLWSGFRVRLALTLAREGLTALADEQLYAARAISEAATERWLDRHGWRDAPRAPGTGDGSGTPVEPA
jgi:hypothetical protein